MLSVLYCYSVACISRTPQGDNSTVNESEARMKSVTSQCQWNKANAQYTSRWNTVASFRDTIIIYRCIMMFYFISCLAFETICFSHTDFFCKHAEIRYNLSNDLKSLQIYWKSSICNNNNKTELWEANLGCYGAQWDVSVSEMYYVYLQ